MNCCVLGAWVWSYPDGTCIPLLVAFQLAFEIHSIDDLREAKVNDTTLEKNI
jgi:hypothetical protein